MGQLCSISDLEIYLDTTITGGDDEAKYTFLIAGVSKEIETICYRTFNSDDYTEIIDGNGTNSIFLGQYPVNTITTIEYGSLMSGGSRDEITDGFVSYADIGEIHFSFDSKEFPQMFSVEYNAGYDTIPLDLNLIAVEEVVRAFNSSKNDSNFKSEKLGDYSYSSFSSFSSAENKSILTNKLAQYIRTDG